MSDDRARLAAALPAYEIGRELGRGGFGVVVEGRHRQLGRDVAIKQLPRSFASDPEVQRRFLAEARILATLDHPHVVPIYDYVEAGGVRLVATDSYRLAVRDLPGTSVLQEGQTVLVPSRALAELNRVVSGAEQVTLRLASAEASFEVGENRLTTRLIEGDFPNYRQLIPQSYPNRLIVGKEPFLNAIRRVKLLAKDATPVRLTLRPDGLELVAVTQDVGQAREDLEAKYEGTEMVVAFNPEFLIDGVEAITGDEVQLETLDALKPATVRSTENPNFLYLLMPVRVS